MSVCPALFSFIFFFEAKNIHTTTTTHAFRIRKKLSFIILNTIMTTPTTPTTTTSDAADGKEEESEEDSKKIITIFVKLLPEPNAEEHKNLTRFQVRDPRARYRFGKTCVFRDVEKTTETVLGVKRRVERETGEKVEMLRRGLRFVSFRTERESCAPRVLLHFFFIFSMRERFFIFVSLFD